MLHAGLELVNVRDLHSGERADRGRRFFRNLAGFGERIGGGKLDFQPLGELVGIAPDMPHLLACVAWNQFPLLERKQKMQVIRCISLSNHTAYRETRAGTAFQTRCPELG